MRKAFGKQELEGIFGKIGKRLGKPLKVFLLGGGAMCFRNQKTATKDLDLVFENDADCKAFSSVIGKIGFRKDARLEVEYRKMAAAGIWTNKSGFKFDLFVKTVCDALELNGRIIARSEGLSRFGRLEINMFSNEDVILFKGITERPGDADDIAAIIRSAEIDWDVILEECKLQSKKMAWYGLLHDKLDEIEERHGIHSPIMKQLLRLDHEVVLKEAYGNLLSKGMRHDEALEVLKKKGFTKKELSALSTLLS